MTDNCDSDMIAKQSEEEVVGKPLEVAPTHPGWVEMMMFRKSSHVVDSFGQLVSELVGKFWGNLVVISDRLADLGRNARVISDLLHFRPTSAKN